MYGKKSSDDAIFTERSLLFVPSRLRLEGLTIIHHRGPTHAYDMSTGSNHLQQTASPPCHRPPSRQASLNVHPRTCPQWQKPIHIDSSSATTLPASGPENLIIYATQLGFPILPQRRFYGPVGSLSRRWEQVQTMTLAGISRGYIWEHLQYSLLIPT